METIPFEIEEVKRLDHLPLVSDLFDRSRIVDDRLPQNSRNLATQMTALREKRVHILELMGFEPIVYPPREFYHRPGRSLKCPVIRAFIYILPITPSGLRFKPG